MNGQDLLKSMGHIDEGFVAEAMETVPTKGRRWKKYIGLAACVALLAGAALWQSQRPYVIRLEDVAVNPVSAVQCAEPSYDPATVQAVSWNSAQIAEYYGKDLTPAYIPENLEPVETTSQILVESDGTVVRDAVELFYCAADPPESHWVDAQAFSMVVSTEQLLIISELDPAAPRQITEIGGVEVSLGAVFQGEAVQCYVAEFALDDLQYYLEFEQMELVEAVKVVASIIQGDNNIVVE